MLSTFTYGPAKAAPARRNGDAATAAIVDLIDMIVFFFCLAGMYRKTLRMLDSLDMGVF